jgi:hypothetical protein
MLTPVVSAVMRRIVLDYLDIADQAGASIGTLHQVMT